MRGAFSHPNRYGDDSCAPRHLRLLSIAVKLLSAIAGQRTAVDILNSKFGSGTGIRTLNLAVNSRLLYRLSYSGAA